MGVPVLPSRYGRFAVGSEGERTLAETLVHCTWYPALVMGIAVGLLSVTHAATTSNIDPDAEWAWSANAGWINLNPPGGGVMVYADQLKGYAWGENAGWIRLGTHTGGGSHFYGNTSATNYGANRDASGNLYGYAWGTNVGWIKFGPQCGGVSIDPITHRFDGYAWGESLGWIHFRNEDPRHPGVSSVSASRGAKRAMTPERAARLPGRPGVRCGPAGET
jgi:hypothetical protein